MFDHVLANLSELKRQILSATNFNNEIFNKFNSHHGHGSLEKFQRQNTEVSDQKVLDGGSEKYICQS